MSKKKKFSSRIPESVDPMTAFVDESQELAVPEDELDLVENQTELELTASSAEEPKAEEPKAEEPKAEEPKAEEPKAEEPKAEEPKIGVLELLHGAEMKPKAAVLEKNALPVQLLNKEAEKEKVVVIDGVGVGKLYDLLEVARQYASGYQPTWDASIKAYARHVGFPNMSSLEDGKAFLVKWGAKLKD